jgi:ApaG protein
LSLRRIDRVGSRALPVPESAGLALAPMPRYAFRVDVQPRLLPEQSAPEQRVWSFAYTITITNTGEVPAQLISRHWIITNELGEVEEVKGLGVVGHQPLLKPGESFEYTSGCRLRTPSGSMKGSYFCVAEDGERFEVEIPLFVLDDGDSRRVLH